MKKPIVLIQLFLTVSLFAQAPSFSPSSICSSLASGFGNAYQVSQKKQSAESFCEEIVQANTRQADFMCSQEQLIDGCVKQISATSKK